MSIRRDYVIDEALWDLNLEDLHLEDTPFGEGAYSKVYKGYYRNDIVCAKLISKDLDPDDPHFFRYVEREIYIFKSLCHQNVVQFFGAGHDDNFIYVVTEYIPGGNMRTFIKQQRGLPWDLKIHIAIGIAQGLQHIHSKNILHRDIKSENFLVGDNWQLKICDFGFSKAIEGDITRKRTHSICGTEEYMAPEMLMGLDYNEKVDIFSYGIFLAELVTQCYLPTDLKRTAATQFGISVLAFKELLPPDCPAQLVDLVLDCCNYVTSSRPSLEKVIHKLNDIREVLPRFVAEGNLKFQDAPERLRRKSAKNLHMQKVEEIVITRKFEFEEIKYEILEESSLDIKEHDIVLHEITDEDARPDYESTDRNTNEFHELNEQEQEIHYLEETMIETDSSGEHDEQYHGMEPQPTEQSTPSEDEYDLYDQELADIQVAELHLHEIPPPEEPEPDMQEFKLQVYEPIESLPQPAPLALLTKPDLSPIHTKIRPQLAEFRKPIEFRDHFHLPPRSISLPELSDPELEGELETHEFEIQVRPYSRMVTTEEDDMMRLMLESFIIVEYPEEENGGTWTESFVADTFTAKNTKYSVYYH